MHTSAFKSCRIHHNSGYEGDIYITNEDSTSIPIGEKATVKFTYRKLVNFYSINTGVNKTLIIKGLKEDKDKPSSITILSADVRDLITESLIQKISDRINNLNYVQVTIVANVLGIKP